MLASVRIIVICLHNYIVKPAYIDAEWILKISFGYCLSENNLSANRTRTRLEKVGAVWPITVKKENDKRAYGFPKH